MCCDGWNYGRENINGECPECGMETVDGVAWCGCAWSECICDLCGDSPCDGSC